MGNATYRNLPQKGVDYVEVAETHLYGSKIYTPDGYLSLSKNEMLISYDDRMSTRTGTRFLIKLSRFDIYNDFKRGLGIG